MRTLYVIVLLLLTTSVYSQKSTLFQNVNVRANELKHRLNKTGDSLILEGERTIYKVEIFNKDFEHALIVKDSKVIIPLNNIPVGRFVVEAALPDKLIVITLLRNEALRSTINTPRPQRKVSLFGKPTLASIEPTNTPETEESIPKLAVVDKKVDVTDKMLTVANKNSAISAKKIALTDDEVAINDTKIVVVNNKTTVIDRKLTIAENKKIVIDKRIKVTDIKPTEIEKKITVADNKTAVIDKKIALKGIKATVANSKTTVGDKKLISSKNILNNSGNRVVESYWIEYKSNNRQSSSKLMRLADDELVNKMIKKINLDKRTKSGKYNELTIWEVYDTTKFLRYKMNHRNNLSSEVDCFNVVPFYKTEKESIKP